MANTKILTWGDIVSRFPDVSGPTGPSNRYPTGSQVRSFGLNVASSIAASQLVPENALKYSITISKSSGIFAGSQWNVSFTLTVNYSKVPDSILAEHPINVTYTDSIIRTLTWTKNTTAKTVTITFYPKKIDSFNTDYKYSGNIKCGLQKSTSDTTLSDDYANIATFTGTLYSGSLCRAWKRQYQVADSGLFTTVIGQYWNQDTAQYYYPGNPSMTDDDLHGAVSGSISNGFEIVSGFFLCVGKQGDGLTALSQLVWNTSESINGNHSQWVLKFHTNSSPLIESQEYSGYDPSSGYGYGVIETYWGSPVTLDTMPYGRNPTPISLYDQTNDFHVITINVTH